MFLYFGGPIQAESVYRFALYKFIDEIRSFQTPAGRHIVFSNLDLLCENVISNFLPVASYIGPFSKHALVSDNSDGKVVDSDAVVLTAHYFRRHIAGRSRSVFRILRVPNSGDT